MDGNLLQKLKCSKMLANIERDVFCFLVHKAPVLSRSYYYNFKRCYAHVTFLDFSFIIVNIFLNSVKEIDFRNLFIHFYVRFSYFSVEKFSKTVPAHGTFMNHFVTSTEIVMNFFVCIYVLFSTDVK